MRAGQSGSGFIQAARALPESLTTSAESLHLAKQVLKPPTPGALHAANVGHAMKENVSGCELLASTHRGAGRMNGACDVTPTGAARSDPHGNHGDNLNFVTRVVA